MELCLHSPHIGTESKNVTICDMVLRCVLGVYHACRVYSFVVQADAYTVVYGQCSLYSFCSPSYLAASVHAMFPRTSMFTLSRTGECGWLVSHWTETVGSIGYQAHAKPPIWKYLRVYIYLTSLNALKWVSINHRFAHCKKLVLAGPTPYTLYCAIVYLSKLINGRIPSLTVP